VRGLRGNFKKQNTKTFLILKISWKMFENAGEPAQKRQRKA
jgi:hypothetical protein